MDDRKILVSKIMDAEDTDEASGDVIECWSPRHVFQAVGTTTSGAGSATILIQGSLDQTNWELIDTLSLTIADENTPDTDWGYDDKAWKYIRAHIDAIAGTGAAVDVFLSED